jgi:hypothetical protein
VPINEARSRYILETDPHKIGSRLMRDVLAYDAEEHRSVLVTVPNSTAPDVLEAVRKAYQQGREDHALTYPKEG